MRCAILSSEGPAIPEPKLPSYLEATERSSVIAGSGVAAALPARRISWNN
jgi:hypothetical protein